MTPLQARCPVEKLQSDSHVNAAISRLSPHLGEAIVLRYFRDMSYAEMAELTGCHEVTLRSRIHHALKCLRQIFESPTAARGVYGSREEGKKSALTIGALA